MSRGFLDVRWISEDRALAGHEGAALFLASDGRTSTQTSSEGLLLDRVDAGRTAQAAWLEGRPPRLNEVFDVVAWDRVVGWSAACSCGWAGSTRMREGLNTWPPEIPVAAVLDEAGTPIQSSMQTEWREHLHNAAPLARLEQAAEALAAARRELDAAVAEARALEPPATWVRIGQITGMTRQAARERWLSDDGERALDAPGWRLR